MKPLFLVFIACISLLTAGYSYSCCNNQMDESQSNTCSESQDYCKCADVNCGKNSCINKAECCQLFGNVGDNKLSDSPY